MLKATFKDGAKEDFIARPRWLRNLKSKGYNAVRVPVSNPSRNPLPDVIARCGPDIYAFEVKKTGYYAYFSKDQIKKLFSFLDQLIPLSRQYKHAVLAAHFGRRWIFREMSWEDWEKGRLVEKERILKRDKGNFNLKKK